MVPASDNGKSWKSEERKLGEYALIFFPVGKKYDGVEEEVINYDDLTNREAIDLVLQ